MSAGYLLSGWEGSDVGLDDKIMNQPVTATAIGDGNWQHVLTQFDEIVAKMRAKFVMKDRAYSNGQPFANIKRCEALGIPGSTGAFIRMTDKYSRLESLIALERSDPTFAADAQSLDETKMDNAFDLGMYAIIWQILHQQERDQAALSATKLPLARPAPAPLSPAVQELVDLYPGPNQHLPCGCVGMCKGHK